MLFIIMGLFFLSVGAYFLVSGGILGIISYTFLPMGAIFLLVGVFFKVKGGNHRKLMQTGLPGTALIKALTQTSMMVNNSPVIKLELEVSPEGRSTFQASVRTPVSVVVLSQVDLKPGSELPVKVDPSKPENFVIDWNAAVMQKGAAATSRF